MFPSCMLFTLQWMLTFQHPFPSPLGMLAWTQETLYLSRTPSSGTSLSEQRSSLSRHENYPANFLWVWTSIIGPFIGKIGNDTELWNLKENEVSISTHAWSTVVILSCRLCFMAKALFLVLSVMCPPTALLPVPMTLFLIWSRSLNQGETLHNDLPWLKTGIQMFCTQKFRS
jgi:hypothetical protein